MRKADFNQEEYWRNLIEMSLTRLFILYILSDGPSYGYALKDKVALFSRGLCTPSEGGIYPALGSMVRAGLLAVQPRLARDHRRKVYYITPKAKEAFTVGIKVWRQVVPLLEEIYRKRKGFRRVKIT